MLPIDVSKPTAILALALAALACAPVRNPAAGEDHGRTVRSFRPPPTENWLDRDAEERNHAERKAWLEHMHRVAPGTDWRAIERANGRAEQERRNALGRSEGTPSAASWTEIGSDNQAGRMHTAVIGPDGQTIYGGSALGGVWRGALDGSGWEPLGDNLWGGAHELLVLPGEFPGEPDVIVAVTEDGRVHVSRNEGLVWEQPTGTPGLNSVRSVGILQTPIPTLVLYARGSGTANRPSILASTDYGRTFQTRWQGTVFWNGSMWIPRTGPAAASHIYVVDAGNIRRSTDGGFTFPYSVFIAGAARAVLTGSEDGNPTLYAALLIGNQWKLYRSRTGGDTWSYLVDIDDFWETLAASILDKNLVVYGGVEVHRSTDGGLNFDVVNQWWEYYDDPVNKLHADTPGLYVWPDPVFVGQERWYVATDGGLYDSVNSVADVRNISLEGLGVSQYYSTLSSRGNWDRLAAGAQDQGYQHGLVQHGTGPSTTLEQLISGDYGHLTSGDGSHQLVYSTYPGFILIQEGPSDPALHDVDFPAGSNHAWLPPVVADPLDPETFYFCGNRLWRFDRSSTTNWTSSIHSAQAFDGDGSYLSALAFAPTDPRRVYAVTDGGELYTSTDHAVTWTESSGDAPPQHYFYGNAITVHPENPLEVAVGGSGYSAAGVIRSIDGGQTWLPEITGLPPTLVYALVYAQDGSGDLYAGTETGAWHWERQTATWENIMANEAPATIYWSAEIVNDGGTVRFGTYGRGAWDYSVHAGDRDGDGLEDAADLCPNNVDPEQLDGDLDGTGDVCDTCPEETNFGQQDVDGDDAGDVCDCLVHYAGAFSVPQEVTGWLWHSTQDASWTSAIPQSGFDTEHVVLRGALDQLPVDSSADCSVFTTQAATLLDTDVPDAGGGYWYLVQGTNGCGTGSLGTWGAGDPRPQPTCN